MSRLPERIIFGLIGLVITGWLGYHIFSYYNRPLEFETVFQYTVSQSLFAEGIAIRDEIVIEQPVSGIENYLFEDAARVSVGQPVAEFYESAGSDREVKRMREIETEIAMLKSAQDKNINNFANADTLNRDIRGQVGQLAEMANTGRFSGARQVRTELVSLLNRRQVATAKVDNFSPRIEALEREYAQLEQGTAGERVVSAQAPVSGYFVKGIDGYEQYLSTKVVGQYGMQDYIQAIRGGIDAPQSVSLGKMLTNQIWYFAAAAKRYNTEHVKAGQSVALEFPHLAVKVPAVVTDLLTENKSDDAVILLECNQLSSDIVNLRREDATLHFTDYTGLRINTASLRFQNGQTGVFVLEDNTVRFKKIKPIYEEQGFILSEINIIDTPGYDKEAVSLFDQVISKGIVYDDQPIQ